MDDLKIFLLALLLCSMTAHVVVLAVPYRAPIKERVIVVSVCLPPPAYNGREQLMPRLVPTEKIVAKPKVQHK